MEKKICLATTKKGERCKNSAKSEYNNEFCGVHKNFYLKLNGIETPVKQKSKKMDIINYYTDDEVDYTKMAKDVQNAVYVYTTNIYEEKCWFKIGMTTKYVEDRVKQQDKTGNPEKLNIKYIFPLEENGLDVSLVETFEKFIHNKLNKFNVRDNREWFELKNKDYKQLIETFAKEFFNKEDAHKPILKLLPHQEEALTAVKNCFNQGGNKFLFYHKPRSGKTFLTYKYILDEKPKNILLITSFPILNEQWIEDALSLQGFMSYDFINLSNNDAETNKNLLLSENNKFVFLSYQDAKGSGEILEKEKHDELKNIEWDLIVIDEVHKGTETKRTEELFSKLNFKKVIGLSATPRKNLLNGTFSRDEYHSYTIKEENEYREKYPDISVYKNLPKIRFGYAEIPLEIKKEVDKVQPEENFTFTKFFQTKNGKLVYENSVRRLFKQLIGENNEALEVKNNETLFLHSDVNNVLLFVPTSDCMEPLVDVLNSIQGFNENYHIIFTNSSENNTKTLRKILKNLNREKKNNNKTKTLVIALKQLTTGITMPDCDTVLFMNDWKSMDEYIQASYRCQSPKENKEICNVIDFNPGRYFNIINEYIEHEMLVKNDYVNFTEHEKEYYEMLNFFKFGLKGFSNIDFEEFKKQSEEFLFKEGFKLSNIEGFINFDELTNERIEILSDFENKVLRENIPNEKLKLTNNGLENGKNLKSKENPNNNSVDGNAGENSGNEKQIETNEEKIKSLIELRNKAIENAKVIVEKTFLMLFLTKNKYSNVSDMINEIKNDENLSEIYLNSLAIKEVGMDVVELVYLLLDYEKFSQKISILKNNFNIFIKKIDEMKLDEALEMIQKYLGISQNEKKLFGEVFTPLTLVDEMLDTLPEDVWKNKDLKWLDPAVGIGNYPIKIYQRLMNGLEDIIPDVEERRKHILENMLYMCDISAKNIFILDQIFNPEKKYKLNRHKGSFLENGFDKKMREWNIEKFDIAVGNPPYNQMIDMLFVQKAYNMSDIVLYVHPSTWLLDEKGKQKKFNDTKKLVEKHLESITLFNGNKLFSVALFVPCVFTFINKNKKTIGIKCVDKINNVELTYDNIDNINKFSNNDVYPTLKNKIINFASKNNLLKFKNLNKEKNYFVNLSQIRGNVNLKNGKDMIQEDFYTFIPKNIKVENAPNKHMFFSFDTFEEANNFINFLKTDFSRFCLSIFKNNSQLDRGELEIIPWLDFTQEWTDVKIYKHFNLTEEEISFIQSVLPDYYNLYGRINADPNSETSTDDIQTYEVEAKNSGGTETIYTIFVKDEEVIEIKNGNRITKPGKQFNKVVKAYKEKFKK